LSTPLSFSRIASAILLTAILQPAAFAQDVAVVSAIEPTTATLTIQPVPSINSVTTASDEMNSLEITQFPPPVVETSASLEKLTIENFITNIDPDDVIGREISQGYYGDPNRPSTGISLNDVVLCTVAKNLNIKLSDIANRIQHDEFHVQEGIFDLQISGGVSARSTDEPILVDTPGGTVKSNSTNKTVSANASVSQLLPTGGVVSLLFDDARIKNNNAGTVSPYYRASTTLSVTHPLLRNAGPLVTQSNIIISQYANQISASQFREQVMNQISVSMQLYFDLIYAVSNVDITRISLAQAQELLRVNNAKFSAGVLPELDVLQAQSDVALRQQGLIQALKQVDITSDQLRTQLAEISDNPDLGLMPRDQPTVPEFQIDQTQFLSEARRFRPELEQVRWTIEQSKLNLEVADNRTLPQLDAFADYGSIGANESWSKGVGDVYDDKNGNWQAGLSFNYPLQNRAARYRFHQAEKNLDASHLRLAQTEDVVTLEVLTGLRNVQTNLQQVALGRSTVEFNKSKVDTGQKRQAVGLATTFDVLAFQSDLATARINLLRAVVDYNKAIVQLEQAKGTLLNRFNIDVRCGEMKVPEKLPKRVFTERRIISD
jgi:outer membrane protein TolC